MTIGLLLGLLAVTQGSVALGAMRWGENVLRQEPEWYGSPEARAVADSVIQYQSPQGGWPKSTDLATPPRSPDDIPPPGRGRAKTAWTTRRLPCPWPFSHAWRTPRVRQNTVTHFCAAWITCWPLRKGYYSHITYNDGAMIRTMTILRDVAGAQAPYDFVDAARRKRAGGAVARGIDCILKTQSIQDGNRSVWCAQHDEKTLEPAWRQKHGLP